MGAEKEIKIHAWDEGEKDGLFQMAAKIIEEKKQKKEESEAYGSGQ
jgi:hypothetical protein